MKLLDSRRRKKRGGGINTSWADWDETTEAGWGDADVYICLMENPIAEGIETGNGGGLAGADLVLTPSPGCNIAGALGAPPKRVLDGVNDHFHCTANLEGLLESQVAFTVIIKLNGMADDASIRGFFCVSNLRVDKRDTKKIRIIYPADSGDSANDVTAGGDLYVVACRDTDGNIYAGFKTTKPTKKADFAVGNIVSIPTAVPLSGINVHIFSDETARSITATGGAYYVIFAKKCLLTGF